MEKFQTTKSHVMPIPIKDVDTDLIIPAEFLTSTSRDGYGNNLFRRVRENDPQFPLNLPQYQNAKILVADSNFGCGSSREHAVWALQGAGFRAVISKSFADIFTSNSAKNGLVLVVLSTPVVDQILEGAAKGNYEVTVDLENQRVTLPDGAQHEFPFDRFRKHCILTGQGDLEYLVAEKSQIQEYFEKRKQTLFIQRAAQ